MKQFAVLLFLLLSICSVFNKAFAETRSYVLHGTPGSDGPPFSGAVKVGETLYLSGDIGLNKDRQVPQDPREEARLLMDRFQKTLSEAGYTMDDLVTVTVYCSDVKHYSDFNEVYRRYFKETFPARAFVGVGTLLFNARFEMQGIAVKRSD
jgi:2-iminobutanoate/2-iminopropanoate deaminase